MEPVSPHDGQEGSEHAASRQVPVRLVVFLVVALLVVLLGVSNRDDVEVEYLVGDAQIPLVWVIVVSLVAGAILERSWTFIRSRRTRRDD